MRLTMCAPWLLMVVITLLAYVAATSFRLAATRSLRSGALCLPALRSEDSASRLTALRASARQLTSKRHPKHIEGALKRHPNSIQRASKAHPTSRSVWDHRGLFVTIRDNDDTGKRPVQLVSFQRACRKTARPRGSRISSYHAVNSEPPSSSTVEGYPRSPPIPSSEMVSASDHVLPWSSLRR